MNLAENCLTTKSTQFCVLFVMYLANAKRAVYSALSYFTTANFNPNALKIFNNVDKFGVV